MKVNKPNKNQRTVATIQPEETEQEEAPIVAEEVNDEGSNTADTVPIEATVPTAAVPEKGTDHVAFCFTTGIKPPPRIGSFEFASVFGITEIKAGQSLTIPRHIACHLKDSKAGHIVQ